MCLFNHAVQHLCNARWVTHLFLITDQVLKDRHLLDFLKAALADGFVGRLGRDEQQRSMVPVGRHDRSDKVSDTRTVLCNGHTHFSGGAGVTIGTHARVALMRTVPEFNARSREQI